MAKEIRRVEEELEPEGEYIQGVADPAIFSSETGESIAEKFAQYGVYFDKADNSRITGWNQMRERMKFDEEGMATLYVFNTCRHFIRTVPSLIHDVKKPEDLDTTQEDHIADECRYLCMARPTAPRIIKVTKGAIYNPLDSEHRNIASGLGYLLNVR